MIQFLIIVNRSFSNSHGSTGSSMEWRLMRANLFKCKLICPIILDFMLDPVKPLEYETGLLCYVQLLPLCHSACRFLPKNHHQTVLFQFYFRFTSTSCNYFPTPLMPRFPKKALYFVYFHRHRNTREDNR